MGLVNRLQSVYQNGREQKYREVYHRTLATAALQAQEGRNASCARTMTGALRKSEDSPSPPKPKGILENFAHRIGYHNARSLSFLEGNYL